MPKNMCSDRLKDVFKDLSTSLSEAIQQVQESIARTDKPGQLRSLRAMENNLFKIRNDTQNFLQKCD